MLRLTMQDGATYSMTVEDIEPRGRVLVISRTGGIDDPPLSNRPMQEDR